MNRITDKDLNAVVARINRTFKAPDTAYQRDEAGNLKARIGHYHLSHAYGGVALHRMANESGGISDVLRTGHVPKRALYDQMHAFLAGVEAAEVL